MSFLYRSERVGKGGRTIEVLKVRTLREGSDKTSITRPDQYLWYGRFLRKLHLDELPQIWNVLKGDMRIFGYRPMERRELKHLPDGVRDVLFSAKPGLVDLASVHFFNEEALLQQMKDPHRVYFEVVRPIKFALQAFYIEHRSWLLNAAIAWLALKKALGSLFKKP